LNSSYSFTLFSSVSELPANWNDLAASTIFLTTEYLEVLERSSPTNMVCHYIGLFHEEELIGIALSQFLDINQLTSFGERDKCIKT
jgi:hypothetical protein